MFSKRLKFSQTMFCHIAPGCGHGVAHRLIAETIEEMGIQDQTIGIAPVVVLY
jgi:2-oxoglutarate ferredoxin oxidoreductase subunit beta